MKKIYFILISIFFVFIFSVFYLGLQNEQIYDTEDLVGKKNHRSRIRSIWKRWNF